MYAQSVILSCSPEEAIERLTTALKERKMGIVSDIDVQATMKAKLDLDMPFYRILGACAPGLAKRVIDTEPEAGTLLPCNVVVRDAGDGRTAVHFLDPEAALSLSDNADVRAVAREAKQLLEQVRQALQD